MKAIRNPFLQRTAELSAEFEFLSLFNPMPLEIIHGEGLLVNKFIRSSPGGGKTTLLRLFTPRILNLLYARRTDFRELFTQLQAMEAIDEESILTVGIYVSCAKTYGDIQSIGLSPQASDTLFFRLLNARILLAAIEGLQDLLGVASREEARRLLIQFENTRITDQIKSSMTTLGELLEWAASEETTVCSILDAFDSAEAPHPVLSANKLYSLDLLSSLIVLHEGEQHRWNHFLMLDDVQWLHVTQRKSLLNAVVRERPSLRVWISERLDALDLDEISHAGDKPGRDFESAFLELHWQSQKGKHAFESMLRGVSDRRARAFRDRTIESFSSRLEEGLDAKRYNKYFQDIVTSLMDDIRARTTGREKYKPWIESASARNLTPREQAILWESMGILLAREAKNLQTELDFAVEPQALDQKIGSDVKAAAELFLSKKYRFPYYYGFSTLADLSTYNVDQFLFIASRLFNEIAAIQLVRGEGGLLTAERQQELIFSAVKDWKESILKLARHGKDLVRLIDRMTKFCVLRTFEANAPYSPGVTGIGLLQGDWERLCAIKENKSDQYYRFANTLRSGLTNNLLTLRLGYQCKGNSWAILYLNRALCATAYLPLQYGGWKEWSLHDFSEIFIENAGRKMEPRQHVLF